MKMRTTIVVCDSCGAHGEAAEAKAKWYRLKLVCGDESGTYDACPPCGSKIVAGLSNKFEPVK